MTVGKGSSSSTWEERLGKDNWSGLLEPELNLKLRKLILRCGNFCEAAYDAFINNNMILPMGSFFQDVVLQDASHYEVRYFLYAPSGSMGIVNIVQNPIAATYWIGYVAVTTDEVSKRIGRREIYVVWRGSNHLRDWFSNLFGALYSKSAEKLLAEKGKDDPQVHRGWLEMYTQSADENIVPGGLSVRDQLHEAIKTLRMEFKSFEEKLSLVVTGHSLGAALATLSAFDLVENNVIGDDIPGVSAFLFSCPKVGSVDFNRRVKACPNLKLLHLRNKSDEIPKVPHNSWNLSSSVLHHFVTICTAEMILDTAKSPYLKKNFHPSYFTNNHNLEALLHVVAWWNGGKDFEATPKVHRNLALVNKTSNYLISDLKVPESWWENRNDNNVMVLEWVPRAWADILYNPRQRTTN